MTSTFAEICWVIGFGCAPMRPAATCAFCARMAEMMSPAVRLRPSILSGPSRCASTAGGEQRCAANAVDASDLTDDVPVQVVAEADVIVGPIRRAQGDNQQKARARLLDAHTLIDDRLWQAGFDPPDAVLHLDLRLADRCSGCERRGDVDAAGGVRGRLEINEPRDAIQFLLDRPRYAEVHVLGRRTGIVGRNRDLRRSHLRVLRNRQ